MSSLVRVALTAILCAALASPAAMADTQAKWTFMVYMDADNNLEDYGIEDFLEMATAGSTADVNILVQMDRTPGYDSRYDNWLDTRRGRVAQGDTPSSSWGVSIGEANMGDPATLATFIQWGVANYPADRYAVVLWDHGNGWHLQTPKTTVRAVCWDDSSGGDCLYMAEVRSALASAYGTTNAMMDVIGFDACLMGMTEVAYEIRNYGRVMTGSEDNEPGAGWPYNTTLGDLVANPDMTPAEFGTAIVDRYYESYGNSQTQAATDLTQMPDLAADIYAFASTMVASHQSDPKACADAARQVITRMDSAIIHERHGSSWKAGGQAIYFPSNAGLLYGTYSTTLEFTQDNRWVAFLNSYYNDMDGTWVDTARSATFQIPGDTANIDLKDLCLKIVQYAPTGLQVTPFDDAAFSGSTGGPYSPAQVTYTLTNYETGTLAWNASSSQPWIGLTPTSGSLASGASAQVNVWIGASASTLGGGGHTGTVSISAAGVSTVERDVSLTLVGQPDHAFLWFPLDTDPGWTRTGSWQFGAPTGSADPSAGASGSNVFGNNLAGNYGDDISEDTLMTGALDCSGQTDVHLSFWRWLGVEGYYDTALVQVSTDASNWTTVWTNPGDDMEEAAWTPCEYDISAVADNQPTVYVRWVLMSDGSFNLAGWNIDDIALTSAPSDPACLADNQVLAITADTSYYAMAWSYAQATMLDSLMESTNDALTYAIPGSGWVGAYLYDMVAGQYTTGLYISYDRPD